jgi:hypothetical protein
MKYKQKLKLDWPHAQMIYPRMNPFADSDKDGKINMFDCRPFNKKKDGNGPNTSPIQSPQQRYNMNTQLQKKKREFYGSGGYFGDSTIAIGRGNVGVGST